MTLTRRRIAAGPTFLALAWLFGGAPLSCATSPTPPVIKTDAGHTDAARKDATTDHGSCGGIGQSCCEPPTPCDVGAFCAADGFCKNQHPSDIGAPCSSPSACSSGICGYTQGITDGAAPTPDGNGTPPPQTTGCTVGCYSTTPDCLPGWTCQQLSVGEGLCTCTWGPEICDGLDNNCDGIVDNEPEVDNACTLLNMGIPQKCVKGNCVCVNTCEGNCVDVMTDNANCGSCGHICTAVVEKCQGGVCGCAYTTCAGKCVDTKASDNANCGDCGVPCDYQCANGSCGAATFASALGNPGSIATDDTNVYWLDEGSKHTQVQYCPLAGCPGGTPMTLAVSSATSSYKGGIDEVVVTATDVYFADEAGDIEVTPISGGTGTATLFAPSGSGQSFMTTAGSGLYWANDGTGLIKDCALGSSCAKATTIENLAGKKPMGLAISGSTIYWAIVAEEKGIEIESAPLAGGPTTTLCTQSGFFIQMRDLLITGGSLYYASSKGGVYVCPLATPGAKASVYEGDKSSPNALATDGTDLYWTDGKANAIRKCALGATCAAATTLTVAKSPQSIALGPTQVYWTESAGTIGFFHK